MEGRKEIIKIQEFPNGKNIVHIPIRTPEEEEQHRKELHRAAVRLLLALERCETEKKEQT